MGNYKVAYIDDLRINCEMMECVFAGSDMEVFTCISPKDFLDQYPGVNYDCIITDIHMPEVDGFHFLETLLNHPGYNKCPILLISSDDSEETRIKSYDVGAVDFLNRMLPHQEIVARVRSKIKFYKENSSVQTIGNLNIDFTKLRCTINRNEIKLTFIEFKILALLIRTSPNVISKVDLIDTIWPGDKVSDQTAYTHIGNLQDKIQDWTHEIIGVKSKGFFIRDKATINKRFFGL